MNIKTAAKWLHDNIGAALAYVAPVIAPLPSAIAVYHATGSVWTAIALETLGFASVSVVLRTYSRNLKHKANPLPLWVPISGFIVYFVAVMWTVITADVLPAWAINHTEGTALTFQTFMSSFGVVFLPLLTVTGALAYGWSAMLDAEDEDDAERKAERRANRSTTVPNRSKSVPNGTPATVPTQPVTVVEQPGTAVPVERIDRIVGTIRNDRHASLATIAKITGVPKTTVSRDLAEAGYHKNGDGWRKE